MAKGRSKPQIHDARYLAELMDKTGVPEIFKARGGAHRRSGQRRGI